MLTEVVPEVTKLTEIQELGAAQYGVVLEKKDVFLLLDMCLINCMTGVHKDILWD